MNKSKGTLKTLLFILVIAVLVVAIYFVYTKITGKENILYNMVSNNSNKKEYNDNYNGIYVSKDYLGGSYGAYPGCTVTSIDTLILVDDKDYSMYEYTCMGTYLIKEGNSTELKFEFDSDTGYYKIIDDDKEYHKDLNTFEIIEGNRLNGKLNSINVDTYQFIMEYSQVPGRYYNLNSKISGLSDYGIIIDSYNDGTFGMTLTGKYNFTDPEGKTIKDYREYTTLVQDNKSFPDLLIAYSKLAIIEKYVNINDLYNYNLKMFSKEEGIIYDLNKYFPITINDTILDLDSRSVFVKYNKVGRYYDLVIGNDNKFCTDNSDSDEVAYYLFRIDYDRKELSLDKPVYQKTYYLKDGCDDLNKIMGG